jgi:hypothetical protein
MGCHSFQIRGVERCIIGCQSLLGGLSFLEMTCSDRMGPVDHLTRHNVRILCGLYLHRR